MTRVHRSHPAPTPRVDGTESPCGGAAHAIVRVTRSALSRWGVEVVRTGGGGGQGVGWAVEPGHEIVGVIEALVGAGSEAGRIAPGPISPDASRRARALVGRRVVVDPIFTCAVLGASAHPCEHCAGGLPRLCSARRILGVDLDGALRLRVDVPVRNLVPVPDAVDDDRAVFAFAAAAALGAAAQCSACLRSPRRDRSAFVTVIGDGPLGLLTAQALAREHPRVRVLGRHPDRGELCSRWGIRFRPERDAGRRADQACVIDCSGSAPGFALATRLVRPRGTIVACSVTPASADLANPAARRGSAGHDAQERAGVGASHHGADAEVLSQAWSTIVEREVRVIGGGLGGVPLVQGLDALASGALDTGPTVARVGVEEARAMLAAWAEGREAAVGTAGRPQTGELKLLIEMDAPR